MSDESMQALDGFPLNLTGRSSDHWVEETIDPAERGLIIIPKYHPFYAHNLEIINTATQTPLVENEAYRLVYLHDELTLKTGRSVYRYIELLNADGLQPITLRYQTVGGPYLRADIAELEALINQKKQTPVDFSSLKDKPDLYPPSPHRHDISTDIQGMDALLRSIESLRQAMIQQPQSLPVASHDEALEGIRNDRTMTPHTVKAMVDHLIQESQKIQKGKS